MTHDFHPSIHPPTKWASSLRICIQVTRFRVTGQFNFYRFRLQRHLAASFIHDDRAVARWHCRALGSGTGEFIDNFMFTRHRVHEFIKTISSVHHTKRAWRALMKATIDSHRFQIKDCLYIIQKNIPSVITQGYWLRITLTCKSDISLRQTKSLRSRTMLPPMLYNIGVN